MPRKYKFFISDFALILSESQSNEPSDKKLHETSYDQLVMEKIRHHFDTLDLSENIVLEHPRVDLVASQLFEEYQVIDAGGGLVMNEHQSVLMIKRRGHWDLPKGKLEAGEQLSDCAMREVKEECGVEVALTNASQVPFTTYHLYQDRGKTVIKASHWFEMNPLSAELVPQLEEDITEVRWMKKPIDLNAISPCYSSIVEVLYHFGAISA